MTDLVKLTDWGGKPRAIIVFFHGLGGHPYATWQSGRDANSLWPLWLGEDVKGSVVYTLGYAAPPSNWLGTAMPLQDRVPNVRARLMTDLVDGDAPIVFICHSLGGLIVKQLLLDLQQQQGRNDESKAFLERVRQVIFFATPHSGSWHANLVDRLRFFLWPTPIALTLGADDPVLRSTNKAYRGLAQERLGRLDHLTFYETQETAIGKIVGEGSADAGLPGEEPIGIDADHVKIAKPESRTALQYAATRKFVEKIPALEGEGEHFQIYERPEIKLTQPANVVPKLARVAMLTAIGGIGYSMIGGVNASCGSNSQLFSFFNRVSINVIGSALDCSKKQN